MNNFNTCDNMPNIETRIFYDSDRAQDDFQENFSRIDSGQFWRSSFLFYTNCGQNEAPSYVSDLFDFSEATEKDFRAFVLEQGGPVKTIKNMIQEKRDSFGTWKDFAFEILDDDGLAGAMRDGLPDINNAEHLYAVTSAQGYSQGDYAEILYLISDRFAGFDGCMNSLIFDAPICARVEIEGVGEYYLGEYLSDFYIWDREQVLEGLKKEDLPEKVFEWLSENMPENIECE